MARSAAIIFSLVLTSIKDSPVPPWPALKGPKSHQDNNLMSNYVSMDAQAETHFGIILIRDDFEKWCRNEL